MMLHPLAAILSLSIALQDSDHEAVLSEEEFREQFEAAFDMSGFDRVEQLVCKNPTRFLSLFKQYAEEWIRVVGEPGPRDVEALERARVLAEKVNSTLKAPGLMEFWRKLEQFDSEDRAAWIAADQEARSELESTERESPLKASQSSLLAQHFEGLGDLARASTLWASTGAILLQKDRLDESLRLLQRALVLEERLGSPRRIAMGLNNVGFCYHRLGQDQRAIAYHRRALAFSKYLGQQELLLCLNNLGFSCINLEQFREAIDAFEQSLPLMESISPQQDMVVVSCQLGKCYRHLGKLRTAAGHYLRALDLAEPLGDQNLFAELLDDLGICYRDLGQLDEAIKYLSQALDLWESLGDPQDIALGLNNLGCCYRDLGQVTKAIDCFQRSLAKRELLSSPQLVANSLNNLGSCFLDMGQFRKAVDYLNRCLDLVQDLDDQSLIASIFGNLGLCYHGLGQFERAIDYHLRAQALFVRQGNPLDVASGLHNIATCYQDLGQFEKAIEYHTQALSLRETVGNPLDIAKSHNNLGNCYDYLGDHRSAIDHYQRSLTSIEPLGHQLMIAGALSGLGDCYKKLGEIEKAIDHYQRAQVLYERMGDPRLIDLGLLKLGACYMILGLVGGERTLSTEWFEKTIGFFQKELQLDQPMGNPQEIASDFLKIGHCFHILGRPDRAIDRYRKGFEFLNAVSLRSLPANEQAQFRRQFRRYLTDALKTTLKLGRESPHIKDGFWITESMRCRSLLGELFIRAEGVYSEMDPGLQSRRSKLLEEMEVARLTMDSGSEIAAEVLQARGNKLRFLEEEFKEVTRQLRFRNPKLMELVLPVPAEANEVQKLLGPGQGLLEYVLGEKGSYLWILSRHHLQLCELPAEAELRRVFEKLAAALNAGLSSAVSFVEPARELYKLLLGPLSPEFDAISEWIIVADGFLGFLPFEVLLADDPTEGSASSLHGNSSPSAVDLAELPYLLRFKSIRYAPSASFLLFHAKNGGLADSWKKDAFLCGDPVYVHELRTQDPAAARAAPPPGSFKRLRGTRDEVIAIAGDLVVDEEFAPVFRRLRDLEKPDGERSAELSALRFDLYLGEEVNEQRLKSDLRGYRILHLATHGYFDPEVPWFSGLVLSSQADGPASAGFLSLLELGTLQLDAQIVFLSACETGTGELVGSEGVQSTARSFLTSGAESVVATLWTVRDDVASSVARAFYRELNDRTSPVAALRQAKLSLIEKRDRGAEILSDQKNESKAIHLHAHPALWAPFVIYSGFSGGRHEK
jgi:tetratricopeptide (TPR) repeat protein